MSVLLLASSLLTTVDCQQASSRTEAAQFDSSLVKEQKRRIAMFDSVVRSIKTDSAYKLWQAALTAPNAKVAQLAVECEYGRLNHRYGVAAAGAALDRMHNTLWRHADGTLVARLHQNLRGVAISIGAGTCGPPPREGAPYWLREWSVHPLPQLPPSPTDSAPRKP